MEVALCYPSVLPARGGCETYIADFARRLSRDGHGVHLVASAWDSSALPPSTHFHRIDSATGPRFLRPWRFAAACEQALMRIPHDISIGFDKTWGQDILFPQGGLHAATQTHNLRKYPNRIVRSLAAVGKWLDPANCSYSWLERKQYLGSRRPTILVNSEMVRGHFVQHYGVPPETLHVIHSAIDPLRFHADDRLKRRAEERESWGVDPSTTVGLFIGMNYRLKGLAPLLYAVAAMPAERKFQLAVVGHRKFAKYERLAESLKIRDRIHFLGFRADPKEAYFAADFLVHPTFYDPCSLVALEAFACGLPVITTRYNGVAELMPAGSPYVIDNPHDARDLARAMTALTDGANRQAAAQTAREISKAWTFEHHYQQFITLLDDVRGLKRAA